MKNENTNQGGNTENTQAQGAGANGLRSESETGVQPASNSVLEKETQGGGTQNDKAEAAGQKENATVIPTEKVEELIKNGGIIQGKSEGNPDWLFSKIWNESLEEGEERLYEPRERIFATELGKAPVDVYLAMKGTPPSNPPNGRSKRKFEAGNMWEWIVGLVLKRAGVIRSSQERVELQFDGMCPVSGRLDYIVGGKVNPEEAKAEIAKFELPKAFYKGFDRIVDYLLTKYPDGLADKPLEIKSLSAFMFEILDKSKKPLRVHVRQLKHYMKAKKFNTGHIVYICRDDCRMMEFVVHDSPEIENDYMEAIALRSGYYKRDEMPPLEKPILWDADMLKFTKNNLGMAYSPYLTLLYKIKDQEEFDLKYLPTQNHFNSVIRRMAAGKKMTPKNEEWKVEMLEMGFDPEVYAKLVPIDAPDEEEAPVTE